MAQDDAAVYRSVWGERVGLPGQVTPTGLDSLRATLERGLQAVEGRDSGFVWGTFQVVRGADLNADGLPDAVLFLVENQRGTADGAVYLGDSGGGLRLAGRERFVVASLAVCDRDGRSFLSGRYQNGLRPYGLAWRVGNGQLSQVDEDADDLSGCSHVEWTYSHPYGF